ncbi:MAG: ATP-dependent 6-phosphofructokinase [Phycisphaeraceae bacterium]
MKQIAVLTSGGDAPGMNAAVRAVVRVGLSHGLTVYGVRHGYAGLVDGDLLRLEARDVSGIIERGGTMLGSARCDRFRTEAGQQQALDQLNQHGIGGVVIIGGNGSQTGAYALSQLGVPVVGVASTIDNDLYGSDVTLGVDTALNVALEAIDRLKVTASSHRRAFLVEVMGRDCGYLALIAGITGGAELVIIPEAPVEPKAVAEEFRDAYQRGKRHAFAVVAEGAPMAAEALAHHFTEHEEFGFDLRVTRLGHVQRGGTPGASDRLLGSRLGAAAVERLVQGEHGVLVGVINGQTTTTPLAEVQGRTKPLDPRLLELAATLAR